MLGTADGEAVWSVAHLTILGPLDSVPHLFLAGLWSIQRHRAGANHRAQLVKHFFCFKTSYQNLTLRSSKKPVFTPFYPHPSKAIFHCALLSLAIPLSLDTEPAKSETTFVRPGKRQRVLLWRLHRYLWIHRFRNNLMV